MNSPKRVLIAGLFHETHTLVPGETTLADCNVLVGEEILGTAGDASVMDGALQVATEAGWQLIPVVDIRAMPGATAADEIVDTWWAAVKSAAEDNGPFDGVFLVLHGAMVSRSIADVEGEMLTRLRALIGPDTPICGATDLHANFSLAMATGSDILVTYRENPHTDGRETAVRAARLLDSLMQTGTRAVTLFDAPPVMWPPTGTATAAEPMLSLERMARAAEVANPELLAVNVHAGYSFSDVPCAGVSFSVAFRASTDSATHDANHETARAVLRKLSGAAWTMRDAGNVVDPSFASVWPHIQAALAAPGSGPIVVAEPSDNIGGGAGGDGTGLLRQLLVYEVSPAAVAIADAAAVEKLATLPPGTKQTLPIGGSSGIPGSGPLELEVEVVSASDGKFDLEDPHSHLASMAGLHIEMGPCVTVKHTKKDCGVIWILLSSLKIPPFDLGQLRSQGIVPEEMALIGVKAAVAHRRAYDPIARASFSVATPGVCASDLKMLPFKNVRRPIFPLDDMA